MALEYVLIALCALAASLLTFYSGFGLGTILMPVLTIFFPLPIAITVTAVVHLVHNTLKATLLWKAINWQLAMRFGGAALIAAIPGAWLLRELSDIKPIAVYTLFSFPLETTLLNIIIGLLLIIIATVELIPKHVFKINNLFVCGVVSGFFGGLSGNQGAFRTIFLVGLDLNKEAYIGTNAAIAVSVDVVRLVIYGSSFWPQLEDVALAPFFYVLLGATSGVLIGMFLLPRMTLARVRVTTITLIYLFGILIALGII